MVEAMFYNAVMISEAMIFFPEYFANSNDTLINMFVRNSPIISNKKKCRCYCKLS